MANPQVENGYTRIANELLDHILLYPFSKRELKVVLAVIRKTYGYNKKSDDIALSQLEKITGLARTHISSTVTELVTRRILTKMEGKYGHVIELNKKYQQWVTKTVRVTKTVTRGYQNGNLRVTKTVTTKDNLTKDNYTKDKCTQETLLPKNFEVSERVSEWAKKNGHSNLDGHLEAFKLKAESKGYKYKNWDSAFMTAIREDWAKLKTKPNDMMRGAI